MLAPSATVEALADSLYVGAPDHELFHYTSITGLTEILKSGFMWASEIRYLNDSEELVQGFGRMATEVKKRLIIPRTNEEQLRQLGAWIEQRSTTGPMMFVAAFTERGNLLSQWRGYCPPTGGVSFGLDPAFLRAQCDSQGFWLGRCLYGRDEQVRAIEDLVDRVIAKANVLGPNPRVHPTQSYHPAFFQVEESILRVCALMKHDAFTEEAEWRAVSRMCSDFVRGVGATIGYRPGRSMLIPYLPFSVTNAKGIVPMDTVIVGPTPHINLAADAVQRLVAKHLKGHGFLCSPCGIPYRTW